ncbi:glycosyltransferase family 4 protein [Flavobacterium ponti]|uniref:Glycosyltransferase family 4 protein n=1 Tax=Flavobacterium ponti TaxID=665133 RepID=A0ABV9P722_9FLAO
MKILHISGAKGWGGNEQQIIYIVPQLNELNVENIVYGINNSVLQDECNKVNIPFVSCKKRKLNKYSNYKHLATTIKHHKPDIVHLHTSDSLMFFLMSNLIYRFNVKLVFSKKGVGVSGSILSKLKYNSKRLDSIICVSKMVQDSFGQTLNKMTLSKTVVINDSVSLNILNESSKISIRKLYNIPNEKFIVGNIANHTNAKDLFTLIDVLAELKHNLKRDDIVFIQVGEFSKKTDTLKQYAIEKKVFKDIVFMDKIKNASSLNSQFDCFLLTSQREGGPTSLLEAMLIGVPVVSTKVGVVSDIIIDGENGFISEIKDSKSLAEKTVQLLDNRDLQNKFSEKGKAIMREQFTAKYIAQKTLEEYQKLVAVS